MESKVSNCEFDGADGSGMRTGAAINEEAAPCGASIGAVIHCKSPAQFIRFASDSICSSSSSSSKYS